jgi:selenocysteine-specific elongation factor
MRVIGTAGHVDHGKSTLVSALTGINPDRLKEEKIREMTIDLGFAWLTLPNGEEVGIIDVPGHRDFIENMLAGVGGIDAVIFVVAADEGVMPQTREHLAILNLLQVKSGIIALTKIDLIRDLEWMSMVEEDVRMVVNGSFLENAPIIHVSSKNGEGLRELVFCLQEILSESPQRKDIGKPRLPIDRVFSISGFGTVVTGTLQDGKLEIGKEIVILPSGKMGRIRGLQTHKRKEERALPGSRVAVNITGLEMSQIKRGDVLCYPLDYRGSQRLDMYFKMLPGSPGEMKHDDEMKIFVGAAESLVRVRLIGKESVKPGEEAWLQIEAERELVCSRGDHYIFRRPSPAETIGGGIILNPSPGRRHKRFSANVIMQYETLYNGTPAEILFKSLQGMGITTVEQLFKSSTLSKPDANGLLYNLIESGQAIILGDENCRWNDKSSLIAANTLISITEEAKEIISTYHAKYPLRIGIPKEELKSRLNLPVKYFNSLLDRWINNGILIEKRGRIQIVDHQISLSAKEIELSNMLMESFQKYPFKPPSVKESINQAGDEIFNMLVDQEKLVLLSEDVALNQEAYQTMLLYVKKFLSEHETITVALLRDGFDTSRKYALAFLEHLDEQKLTIRHGDEHRLFRDHRANTNTNPNKG